MPDPLSYPQAPVEGDGIRLRPFTDKDLAMVIDLSADPYVPLISSLRANADRAEAQAWLGRQSQRLVDGVGYSFCIADPDDDRAVGQAGLWLSDLDQGRANAGYLIAPSARGRGLAGKALSALTRFAWTLPDLHRIELYIEPWNTASRRTAVAAGFRREGLLRSHQSIGGKRVDMEIHAIVR